jgi:carboxyl-terminal processing protease
MQKWRSASLDVNEARSARLLLTTLCVACILPIFVGAITDVPVRAASTAPSQARPPLPGPYDPEQCFDKVCRLVSEQFWDPNFNGVDWEEATRRYRPRALAAPDHEAFAAVVNEMLAELRTSHTCYLTKWDPDYYTLQAALVSQMLAAMWMSDPAELEKHMPGHYSSQARPHRAGIGVVTKQIEGRHYVSYVLAQSPAQKARIVLGDLLVEVEGEPFHPIRSFEGKAGHEVKLVLQRGPDESTRRTVTLKPVDREEREVFENDSAMSTRIVEHEGHRFAYMPLCWLSGWHMRDVLDRGFELACESEGLIIDLRHGFGGGPSIEYIDPFLRTGLERASIESVSRGHRSLSRIAFDGPIVVLIGPGSRSGKELLAWYFKKTGRGTLVGERTAGWVSGGRPLRICEESLLYCCVAAMTIDGEPIEGVGVPPDIEVPFDIRFAAGRDLQLNRALDEMVRQLRTARRKE